MSASTNVGVTDAPAPMAVPDPARCYLCPKHGIVSEREVRTMRTREPECMVNWFGGTERCREQLRHIEIVEAADVA